MTRLSTNEAVLLAVVCGSFTLAGCGAVAGATCTPPRDADKAKLADFVQKKYRVPAGVSLEVIDAGPIGSSCFRKLQFRAAGGLSPFHIELIASPDLHFLARELIDSRIDPIQEEIRKHQELVTGLLRGNPPSEGPREAPVSMVIFSDFQCPFCSRMADTVREVRADQGELLRVVYRYFPLPMHPWARPAAEGAACAGEQGDAIFWDVHDFLFSHQTELTNLNVREKLKEHAAQIRGINVGRFNACVDERKMAKRVEEDARFGSQIGVHGTPTVFLNGRQIQIVGPEQLRTLVREMSADPAAAPATTAQDRPAAPTPGLACPAPGGDARRR